MAKISTYPILSDPTINDILIGTDVEDLNITKNFSIGSIVDIVGGEFVPYVGATGNVNLGAFNITSSSFIVSGGLSSQFLKANGTLDSTVYVPATRTITINSVGYDLSSNRSWDLNTIDSLTTTGTSGAATYIGKTLNIPQYQAQGSYITQLNGEATAVGPGNATITLSNLAVISKVLSGLNITGGTISDTDSILTAFGKVQNQINGLAGGVTYEGTWNAATNTPTLTSSVGTQGHYYVVSVAGNTNLNGITDWQIGDWAIFNGSAWQKVDNTDAVVSVNGYTGAVVLTYSDVGAPPATRTLTINGVGYDLSADRSWTVGDVRTDQTYSNPTWISSLAWGKITGTPTTLAGYGITDGALNTTTLTINGTTYNLSANRTWNVGTVTSVGTSGPLTGGTITGSGTIGITQAGASSDGYLSSTDWNTFNNKQNALTNPVTGTGTIFTLPMWSGATSLVDSPLSYGPDTFNFQYNSATGGTVNFTNIGLTTYTYSIQMNNFGSPRSTVHSYTDGLIVQSIGGTQVSRVFANGNTILGAGAVDNGYKLEITGNLYVNSIANATTDTDRFIVSDGGVIKYRTGSEILSDIGAVPTTRQLTINGTAYDLSADRSWSVGTVTSVGLSMPSAFTVSNTPVTGAGTLTVVGAGTAEQYVRGDGTLGDFPGGGGGSSVSYYLNGSVNQGTFVGNTYYEMSKTPVFGAGTDFNINTNGYIAQFITDANDPESLLIPGGNWNLEFYFSASSGGGSPTFYVELYKYDGTTFTLIASNSTNPELISLGTTINPYFSALGVPETVLAATDRLAIRIYVTNAGRTITLHTENSHLCQVITTFTTGLTALNGLTKQVQYLTTGTSGSDFNIVSSVATHTFNLPTATSTVRGALSSADWITFNSKQDALTNPVTGTGFINVVPKFTGTSTIGNSSITDNTNEVSISKRLALSIGIESFIFTPNLGGTTNRIETVGTLPLALATAGPSITLAAGGTTPQFTLASDGSVTLTGGLNGPSAAFTGNVSSTTGVFSDVAFFAKHNAGFTTVIGHNGIQGDANGFVVANSTKGFRINFPNNNSYTHTLPNASGTIALTSDIPTNPVGGTGTTNYLPKFTGSTTIGNSQVFDNGTNVGIGTTSPSTKLDVRNAGAVTLSVRADGITGDAVARLQHDAIIRSTWTANRTTSQVVLAALGTFPLVFNTNNAERMQITSGGNVLIGTTTDFSFLGTTSLNVERNLNSGHNIRISNQANNSSASANLIFGAFGNSWVNGLGSNSSALGNNLYWAVDSSTSPLQYRMVLTAGGNVLIGTTTDNGAKLNVNGRIQGQEFFSVGSLNDTDGSFLIDHPGVQTWKIGITNNNSSTFSIGNDSGGSFAAKYFNITNSGNVGIGTASPQKTLEATSNANDFVSVGVAQMGVGQWTGIHFGYRESNTAYRKSAIVFERTDLTANDAQGKIHILNGPQGGAGSATLADAKLTIAENGNVGIGTTSPNQSMHSVNGFYATNRTLPNNTNISGIQIGYDTTDNIGIINTWNSRPLRIDAFNDISFRASGTDRLTIKSGGNVLIGTTTDAGYTLNVAGNAQIVRSGTSTALVAGLSGVTGSIIRFSYNGGFVGSISTDGSNTAYNTSSDYRLKQDIKDFNGLDLLSRIKTYDFEWKSDKTRSYGVLAHELQEVINYAVHGSKDAEEMQGVDYSKLVPILIKAIQELNEKIK